MLHLTEGIDHSLSLFRRPAKTNLWAGKSSQVMESVTKNISFAIDAKITADLSAGQ